MTKLETLVDEQLDSLRQGLKDAGLYNPVIEHDLQNAKPFLLHQDFYTKFISGALSLFHYLRLLVIVQVIVSFGIRLLFEHPSDITPHSRALIAGVYVVLALYYLAELLPGWFSLYVRLRYSVSCEVNVQKERFYITPIYRLFAESIYLAIKLKEKEGLSTPQSRHNKIILGKYVRKVQVVRSIRFVYQILDTSSYLSLVFSIASLPLALFTAQITWYMSVGWVLGSLTVLSFLMVLHPIVVFRLGKWLSRWTSWYRKSVTFVDEEQYLDEDWFTS